MIYQRLFKEEITSKTQINEWVNTINSDIKYLEGLLGKVISQLEVCKKFLSVPFNKKQLPELAKLDLFVKDFEKEMYERSFYYTGNRGNNFEAKFKPKKEVDSLIAEFEKTYKNKKRDSYNKKEQVTNPLIEELIFYTSAGSNANMWEFRWFSNHKKEYFFGIGFRTYTESDGRWISKYFTGESSLPKLTKKEIELSRQEGFINNPSVHTALHSIDLCSKSESEKFSKLKIVINKFVQRFKSTGLFVDTQEMKIANIPTIISIKKKENQPLVDQTISILTEIIESLTWFKPYSSKIKFIKILDDKKTLMSLYGRKGIVDPYAYYSSSTKEVFMPIVHQESEIRFYKSTIRHELFHHVFSEVFEKNETKFNELKNAVDKILKSNDPIYPSSYAYSYFKNPGLVKRGIKTQYNEYCAEVMAYDNGTEFDELRKEIIGLI